MSGALASQNHCNQNTTVGIGQFAVSNNNKASISVYALGSCIAVVAYDSQAKAGGIIHVMLPDSRLSPGKAQTQPAMFADTGIPLMFRNLSELNAEPRRLRIFVAGGASVLLGSDMFKIGERNIAAVREILGSLSIPAIKGDVGGISNRSLKLDIESGEVTLKTARGTAKLTLV